MTAEFYGDLHIHIGRTRDGSPVKITASRSQTLQGVFREAAEKKGLDMVGIVDAACPRLYQELVAMVKEGEVRELNGGGLCYRDRLTVIPGAEVETTEENGFHTHWLAYFPSLELLGDFAIFLSGHLTNPELSTQPCRLPARVLLGEVISRGGIFLPAHAFTPHKGIYGQCTGRIKELLGQVYSDSVFVLELGLSADTDMADRISELADFTFISNSDAHSLKNIGREFNVFLLEEPNWSELLKAFRRSSGRRVVANYGLNPKLGKYHRTYCPSCKRIAAAEPPPVLACPYCGSEEVVKGVYDRIMEIGDLSEPRHPEHRPPYYYQVPLYFLPGIGSKTVQKLLDRFGSEIEVLHRASREDIVAEIGMKSAEGILQARRGNLRIRTGGGGTYGKVGDDYGTA